VRRGGVWRSHEVAHGRLRQLGDPAKTRERGSRHAALPARDGHRLDAKLVCELLLGETDAAPRGAQSPPQSATVVGPQARGSYHSGRPGVSARIAAQGGPTSAIPEPDPTAAALAALVALRQEERATLPRQPVAEDSAAERHAAGPTATSILSTFSPRRSPMNALGAFSIPSTIVSRERNRPSLTHSVACRTNSPKRSPWSLMM